MGGPRWVVSRLRGRLRQWVDASLDRTDGQFTAGTAPVKVPVASPMLFLISCLHDSLESEVIPVPVLGARLTALPPQWTTCSPTWA